MQRRPFCKNVAKFLGSTAKSQVLATKMFGRSSILNFQAQPKDVSSLDIRCCKEFVATPRAAFTAECESQEDLRARIQRSSAIVKLYTKNGKLEATIDTGLPDDEWEIVVGTELELSDEVVFLRVAPAQDGAGRQCWTAIVTKVTSRRTCVAVINNRLSNTSDSDGRIVRNVQMTVIDSREMTERLTYALDHSERSLLQKTDQLQADDPPRLCNSMQPIRLSRLLIEAEESKIYPISQRSSPISLRSKRSGCSIDTLLKDLGLEESHHASLTRVASNEDGITGLHGPPATAKSTLLAKLSLVSTILSMCLGPF